MNKNETVEAGERYMSEPLVRKRAARPSGQVLAKVTFKTGIGFYGYVAECEACQLSVFGPGWTELTLNLARHLVEEHDA